MQLCLVHRLNSTSMNLLITNSTSMKFIPIALKIVLVEFVLVLAAPSFLLLGHFPLAVKLNKKSQKTMSFFLFTLNFR